MTRDEALFWLVVVGVAPALYLAGWGLSKVPRVVRGWRYDWAEAKHLTGPAVVYDDPVPDFYGSMSLADETMWPAPTRYEVAHEPDWLAQTHADLAPEALDSGPGVTPSVDPGPDPASHGGDAQGREGGCAPAPRSVETCREPRRAARAHVTGSLSPRHSEEDPGQLARGWPGLTRLADTGDILDAHLAADVAAYQRAQDDQVRAWCSGWERERREYTRQLAEAWA